MLRLSIKRDGATVSIGLSVDTEADERIATKVLLGRTTRDLDSLRVAPIEPGVLDADELRGISPRPAGASSAPETGTTLPASSDSAANTCVSPPQTPTRAPRESR